MSVRGLNETFLFISMQERGGRWWQRLSLCGVVAEVAQSTLR